MNRKDLDQIWDDIGYREDVWKSFVSDVRSPDKWMTTEELKRTSVTVEFLAAFIERVYETANGESNEDET